MVFLRATTITIVFLSLANLPSYGADNCPKNGCGPRGWLGVVVPDRLIHCSFKEACDQHDTCYSRCFPCGLLYGSSACEGTCEQKQVRKDRCDIDFLEKMRKDNRGRAVCSTAALAYYFAVRYRGCNYFRKLRTDIHTREQFQEDFRSIFNYLERQSDLGSSAEIDMTLRRFSTLNASDHNRLGIIHGKLSVVNEDEDALGRKKNEGPNSNVRKRIVNGIDVTNMIVDGELFDLDTINSTNPKFDSSGLTQETIR